MAGINRSCGWDKQAMWMDKGNSALPFALGTVKPVLICLFELMLNPSQQFSVMLGRFPQLNQY